MIELEYQGAVDGYHNLQDSIVRKVAREVVAHTYESGSALDALEMLGLIKPQCEMPDYATIKNAEDRQRRKELADRRGE